MIKSLARLLGNMAGSVKKDMGAYYLTIGAIFVPLGFIILLEYHDKQMAAFAFILGSIGMLMGIRTIQKDEKETREVEYNRWQLQTKIQLGMLDELKKLRGEKDDKPDSGSNSD